MKKWCLFIVCLTVIATIVNFNNRTSSNYENSKYTYKELMLLSNEALLNVFIENGLTLDEYLENEISKKKLADVFKSEFDLMISEGTTSLNYGGYYKMAKDVKDIYENIVE